MSKDVWNFCWGIYHSHSETRSVLSYPFLSLVALSPRRPHSRPILATGSIPTLLSAHHILSFSLSPSYTDRGRFQPSSRLPLMDRRRLHRRLQEVAYAIASIALSSSTSCFVRNLSADQTSADLTISKFPRSSLSRSSVHRSVLRSPHDREYSNISPDATWRNALPAPLSSAQQYDMDIAPFIA